MLAGAETVIVDEIHAVAGDKRGAHLALSLERLDALRRPPAAAHRPVGDAEADRGDRAPAGRRGRARRRRPTAHRRHRPPPRAGPRGRDPRPRARRRSRPTSCGRRSTSASSSYVRHAPHDDRLRQHAPAGRARRARSSRSGSATDRVAAHHGSLSRRIRLEAEEKLKAGEVPVVVATASLELGIDVGTVDLVCQLGSPRALATLLQRVGRSGHCARRRPEGHLLPAHARRAGAGAAAVRAVRAGELDRLRVPREAARHPGAADASRSSPPGDDRRGRAVRARPARLAVSATSRARSSTRCSRCWPRASRRGAAGASAHLHRDRVHGRVRGRAAARGSPRSPSGGAIPDTADYDVVEEPAGPRVGTVNEDFAIESMARRHLPARQPLVAHPPRRGGPGARRGRARRAADDAVLDRRGAGAHARAVARRCRALRERRGRDDAAPRPPRVARSPSAALDARRRRAARRVRRARRGAALGARADRRDASSPSASSTRRAACSSSCTRRSAGASTALGPRAAQALLRHASTSSCRRPRPTTASCSRSASSTASRSTASSRWCGRDRSSEDLVQAVLAAPMFGTRWRWNATRALALLRHEGGKRVPMPIQRMRAEDLLAAVFPRRRPAATTMTRPDRAAGPPAGRRDDRQLPARGDGHRRPARACSSASTRRRSARVAIDTPAPSPMSHEILNANPYTFLDDAPLEERRARAVSLRRTDPGARRRPRRARRRRRSPRCGAQAWPDVRDADELHDALLSLGLVPRAELEAAGWAALAAERWSTRGRATWARRRGGVAGRGRARRRVRAARCPARASRRRCRRRCPRAARRASEEDALARDRRRLARVRRARRPSPALAARLGLAPAARRDRRSRGSSARASRCAAASRPAPTRARSGASARLLARIHRLTLGRLRREIEPVLGRRLHALPLPLAARAPGTQLHGRDGLAEVIGQLQGLELPARAWEAQVLPARIARYDPGRPRRLCLSGVVAWGRLARPTPPSTTDDGRGAPRARRRPAPRRSRFVAARGPRRGCSRPATRARRRRCRASARGACSRYLGARGASFLADIAARDRPPAGGGRGGALEAGRARARHRRRLRRAARAARRPTTERAPRAGSARAARRARARARARPAAGRCSRAGARPPAEPRRRGASRASCSRRYGVVLRELLARETLHAAVARRCSARCAAGGARRGPRRPLRRRARRRAVRAARGGRGAARRRAGGRRARDGRGRRRRPAEPGRHPHARRARAAGRAREVIAFRDGVAVERGEVRGAQPARARVVREQAQTEGVERRAGHGIRDGGRTLRAPGAAPRCSA